MEAQENYKGITPVSEDKTARERQPSLYFDGRKDNTIVLEQNGTKFYRREVVEEHISLIQKSEGQLLQHVTPARKQLTGCEKLAVVKFKPIPFEEILATKTDLSKDQLYLLKIVQAVQTGECSGNLAAKDPGPLIG
ncbi:hypothetical protein ILUMI_01248 [Ignelater luminosus]|uniref:Uncharacterized protein n=1 Tax=Ignelater luminosus TaxID=2038154 RepID=A0A8K0DKG7_IGNLU|nr:hypothetical protein ILUMI_01248 [Ignelater luminosus]